MTLRIRTSLWLGLLSFQALLGCNTPSSQSETAATGQSQSALTWRSVELAQPSPYFLFEPRSGRLLQKGWLSEGTRVSRYVGLPNTATVFDGITLEMVDTSPPAFTVSTALREAITPITRQAQFPLQPVSSCPLLDLSDSGRLSQRIDPSITSAAVLGRVGDYALISGANDVHFLSAHCVPDHTFTDASAYVPQQQYYMVPHANPQDPSQAIQLGADIETGNLELIAQWFRPPDTEDDAWFALGIFARVAKLRSTLDIVIHRLESTASTALPDQKATGWLKTRFAPEFLASELDCEGLGDRGYIVEVKIDRTHLVTTLEALIRQLDTLRQLGLTDASRHVHISFPATGITEKTAGQYANFYHYINEYLTLSHLAYFGDIAALHKYFRPIVSDDVEFVRNWLRSSTAPTLLDEQTFRHVAFRTPALYGSDRYGFEVRAFANKDALRHQINVVATTILFLLNPDINLQNSFGSSIATEDFAPNGVRVDTLNDSVTERLPPEILSFLDQLASIVDPDQELDPSAPVMWAMPLVRWWERQFLAPLQPSLEKARDDYLAELQRYHALMLGSAPPAEEDLVHMVSSALSGWANETGLWQHFQGDPIQP